MLDFLGLKPLFNLKMRLGEGTGAALGMSLLEAGWSHLPGNGHLRRSRGVCTGRLSHIGGGLNTLPPGPHRTFAP